MVHSRLKLYIAFNIRSYNANVKSGIDLGILNRAAQL